MVNPRGRNVRRHDGTVAERELEGRKEMVRWKGGVIRWLERTPEWLFERRKMAQECCEGTEMMKAVSRF